MYIYWYIYQCMCCKYTDTLHEMMYTHLCMSLCTMCIIHTHTYVRTYTQCNKPYHLAGKGPLNVDLKAKWYGTEKHSKQWPNGLGWTFTIKTELFQDIQGAHRETPDQLQKLRNSAQVDLGWDVTYVYQIIQLKNENASSSELNITVVAAVESETWHGL